MNNIGNGYLCRVSDEDIDIIFEETSHNILKKIEETVVKGFRLKREGQAVAVAAVNYEVLSLAYATGRLQRVTKEKPDFDPGLKFAQFSLWERRAEITNALGIEGDNLEYEEEKILPKIELKSCRTTFLNWKGALGRKELWDTAKAMAVVEWLENNGRMNTKQLEMYQQAAVEVLKASLTIQIQGHVSPLLLEG